MTRRFYSTSLLTIGAMECGPQQLLRWCLNALRRSPEEFGLLVSGREVGGADEGFDFREVIQGSLGKKCDGCNLSGFVE